MSVKESPPEDGSTLVGEAGYCVIESVKSKNSDKEILQAMMLTFPVNSVTAILGPSGSGKSTALSVLTDSIPLNLRARADLSLPGLRAIVPQDDRLHGFYTVQKYLEHYAHLTGMKRAKSQVRIPQLMSQLGLSDQANTIVGDVFLKGLSGGQQRRLSVALEALTEPLNFFLDEPTSGLDAESARQVLSFLRDYSREAAGRRVILTIHQPSSFLWEMMDHIILLSKGQLIYNGPRACMEEFFAWSGFPTPEHWNPADHYVTAVNDEFELHDLSVVEWAAKFVEWTKQANTKGLGAACRSKSMVKASHVAAESHRSRSPLVTLELTKRYFLNLAFNPGIIAVRIVMYAMLGLMVGALFWNLGDRYDFESVQSRSAVLFYCVAFFIFMSVAVLPFTVIERAIIDKEVLNQYYHPWYYQVSQFISSIPGTAVLAFVTTLVIITMTKLNEPYWYFLNMFLSLMVAEALAQLVSHVVPHFVIGMALIAGLYGFFMLFQGFMLVPSQFPNWLRWVYNVAFHTYSWRTFMWNEFSSNQTFTGSEAFATGEDVLIFYEIENVDRVHDMITLAGYCLVVHLVSLLVLQVRYFYWRGQVEPITTTRGQVSL